MAAAVALIGSATASAAPPAIKFEKRQPKTALLGTKQPVELVAENPEGQPRGYNLTFRDVLPAGVSYAGGASPAPTIIENKPATGQTTLLFENVSDLSPKSSFTISFEVKPAEKFFKLAGNKNKYTDVAEAFISEKPRRKANFEKTDAGNKKAGEWTETAEEKAKIAVVKKSATTELTAIEIVKSEPSPEGEILRGVHDHQTVYTLTVKNNKVGPTEGLTGKGAAGKSNKSIIVEDWLPAGLEFLGCGKADNTTNTSTNPGSTEEYPGSGAIDPGHAPAVEGCVEPFYVKTEETDPPSEEVPFGTYTHVKWEGPESLLAGAEFKIRYVAAIPLRKNTKNWLGAEPAPEGGGVKQIANLANNTGGETLDEEPLVNNALAKGRYEATEVKDEDEMLRTAEDLAIQKGTNPEQNKIFDGAETNWTLKLETSEYRRSEPVSITDELPNGLCPIGPRSYEAPLGNPTEPKPECAASATRHPTVEYLKGGPAGRQGKSEQIEYSLAKEEATGGFTLKFSGPEVEALQRLEPSQELLITFPTTTRVFYQKEFKDNPAKPILTGDSWLNKVSVEAPSYTRCYVETGKGSYEADPNCEKPGTVGVASERGAGPEAIVKDVSSAGQKAGGVEIEKTVRKNEGLAPAECKDPSSDYVKGLVSPTEPALPRYRPGDEICWRLVVRFPSNLYAGKPVVSDFIPPDEELVQGSEVEGESNNVESTLNKEAAKEEFLEWTLGSTNSVAQSKTFEVRFKTKVSSTPASAPGEISGNLMKFSYSNSEGVTFPLRDRSEVEREEPNVEVKKKVLAINGAASGATTAKGGDKVKFGVEIPNTGTLEAEEMEVWDNLPTGLECGVNVVEISNGGECVGTARIVWKGIAVAPKSAQTLTYVAKLPSDLAPMHQFKNTAGVVQFKSKTNTGGRFTYIPEENINPGAGTPNAGNAKNSLTVNSTEATVKKTATSETTQAGNKASEATIGETILYTVTAKTPINSVLYETATLRDEIPAGLELVGAQGGAEVKLGGEPNPPGFTVTETNEGGKVALQVNFPETFTTGSTPQEITLTFRARVQNIAANFRGVVIKNNATLSYHDKDKTEGSATTLEPAETTLVEPELKVSKKQSIEPSEVVKPGDQITYTVGAEDVEGHSTANNVVLVDSVPLGMEVVGSTEGGIYNQVARTITWTLPVVEPGTLKAANTRKYTLEIEKPAKAASVFNNKVTGTTQSMPTGEGPGRTAANNQGSTAYESSATRSSHLVGASIAKTVEPGEGTIGSPLKYTVTLTLPPSIEYFDTTVVDTLPEGVAFDRTLETKIVEPGGAATITKAASEVPGGPEGTPQRFGWYFGTLTPSKFSRELVVEFEGHVKGKTSGGVKIQKGTTLTNSATGLYNGEDKGKPTKVPDPAGNSFSQQTTPATAKTTVDEPSLSIAKSVEVQPGGGAGPKVQPGANLLYKLVVTNGSTWNAYNAKVTDTNPQADLRGLTLVNVPAGVKVLSTAPLSLEIAEVPKKGSVAIEYTAKLAESKELKNGDAIVNRAAIPSFFGVPANERKEGVEYRQYAGNESSVELSVALPQLALKKTAGPKEEGEAEARIGQPFAWQIEVSNKSTAADAKAVNVFDKLPEGWEYVKGSSKIVGVGAIADPTLVGGELEWATNRALGHGASFKLTFEAKPTTGLVEKPGIYVNEARTTGQDLSGASSSASGAYAAEGKAKAKLKVPSLGIEKTPDEGPAVAGKDASYSIAVTNSGEAEATGVEVTDVLDEGNEYTAGKASAEPPGGFEETGVETNTPVKGKTTVHWKVATIPAAKGATPGKVTITVPVHVSPTVASEAKLLDIAAARSAEQPTAVENGGSLKVSREADLVVEKTTTATSVIAGEDIEYNLHVENKGPSEAEGVTLTDQLPKGTKLVSADSPCVEAGGGKEVVCELHDLKLGFKADYKVKLQVLSSTTGSVVNKAVISSRTTPTSGNSRESEVSTPVEPKPALSIVKTGPAQPVLLGSTYEYELTVANTGPSDAVGVEVKDPLPAELEFVSAEAPCKGEGNTVGCALGTLRPGESLTLHLTVKAVGIPAEGKKVVNVAELTSTTEPGVTRKGEAETLVLPASDLAITKTAPVTVEPDGTLAYDLHVENLGPSIAHQVTVTDPLPAGVAFVSASQGCAFAAGVVTCTVQPAGELAVGAATDFQVTVHVPYSFGGQSLVNTAAVKGEEGDPNTENDLSTATTIVGPAADLSITKTMGKAEAGKPLTYTLAVTNKGPSTASAVTVKDTLPAGTTFSSAAPSQGSCSAAGQDVTCALGPLVAGGSAQVSITVEVGATVTGSLRNVGKVEAPEPDPDKTNNESSVEGPVTPLPPPSAPLAPLAPNLKVVKTASTNDPQVGTPFDYQVTVSNMGGTEAKDVKVVDTLNGPVKVLSIESDSGKCTANGSKIECTIPSVAVGKSVHITYSVVAEAAGPLSNTASAQASNGEMAPANNHAVKSVKAKAAKAAKASFTLTKTAAKKVVRGGGKVAFTITLRNGPTALVDAKVCDRLPAALVFVKAAGASFVEGEACWRKKYVAAHKVLRLHLTARAVRGFKPREARNVASAGAANAAGAKHAAATVRIKPAFAGAPGGVTG